MTKEELHPLFIQNWLAKQDVLHTYNVLLVCFKKSGGWVWGHWPVILVCKRIVSSWPGYPFTSWDPVSIIYLHKTGNMATWIKVLATTPDDLCSDPGTHMVERTDSCKLSDDLPTCIVACWKYKHMHTCIINKYQNPINKQVRNFGICHNMGKLWTQNAKWNRKVTKRQILFAFIYMNYLSRRSNIIETESRLKVTRDQGFGDGELLFNRSWVFILGDTKTCGNGQGYVCTL